MTDLIVGKDSCVVPDGGYHLKQVPQKPRADRVICPYGIAKNRIVGDDDPVIPLAW